MVAASRSRPTPSPYYDKVAKNVTCLGCTDKAPVAPGPLNSAVPALVDEDHLTFIEVGELIGVTRQMVARLYRRAAAGSGPAAESRDEN